MVGEDLEELTMEDIQGGDTAGATDDATRTAVRDAALKAVAALKADAAPKLRRLQQMGMAMQRVIQDQ